MAARDPTVRVLHVDDDPTVLELAAEFLERERPDFEVVTETDAAAALDRLADERFDGVVSDYEMPGMDGLEFLTAVRESHPELPFVLFTGKGTEEIASEAISAGVTDYLQKGTGPDGYTVLANRLGNAIERRRTERRAARRRRVNRLVTEVNQSLIGASTRRAIEESTCRIIDDADPYEFACIGAVDGDATRVLPAALDDPAGPELLAGVVGESPADAAAGLGARAARERTVVVANDVRSADGVANDVRSADGDPWRELAVERDCRALAVVPLEGEDGELLGLLSVFAAEPGVFDEQERALLAELGSDVERAIREVEVRERFRRTKERFRKVFAASNDAIMVVDMAEEAFLEVNPAACEMLGYDREELLELDPADIHPEDIDRVREEFVSQVLAEGSGWTDDLACLTKDGEAVPTEISGAVLDLVDGDEPGSPSTMVAILRDISEREAYRSELEQQLERLDEFVAVLSHDLRNPLNVATANVEMARERYDDDALAEAAAALDRIDGLVDRSLTLARSGRQAGDPEPVAVADLAERCWRTVVTDGADLQVGAPPTVEADPERLRQLFENLIRNSVEHAASAPEDDAPPADGAAPADDAVEIRIDALAGEDGFYVEDDGPGIPEGERERVLRAGYSSSDDGTGLGLAIVRRIAEAHGWDVDVTESADGGARFEFTGVDRAAEAVGGE